MNLLREYIREMLKEQNVLAVGMCFPFAAKKAEEWFDDHFEARKGRAPKRHPDLNNMDKFKVVHGKVTNKWQDPPKPIVHAWVEMGDLVFDDQTKMTKPGGVPKDVYYDTYQPEVIEEYSAEDAVVNCVMKGEGPWNKELVDIMKQRDEWMNETKELFSEGSRIVPTSMTMSEWESYKKKNKTTAKAYDKKTKTKWKITHGPGHKDAGKTIKGNTGLTYEKAKSIQNAFGGW